MPIAAARISGGNHVRQVVGRTVSPDGGSRRIIFSVPSSEQISNYDNHE